MKKLITLPLLISMTGLLFANQSLAITQSQMQMRATATCDSYASMSRIASPGVVYEVCLNGAKESMQGQKCSIKVWFSQSGNVLSIKVESGDNDACSYVLKRTQKIKLSAMNDSQYKVFRNTPIDFSF